VDVDLVHHWSVSGDGRTIATLTDLGQVRVYDAESGNLRFTTTTLALMKPGPLQMLGNRPPDAPSGNQIDRFELSRNGRFLLIVGRKCRKTSRFCQILDGLTGDAGPSRAAAYRTSRGPEVLRRRFDVRGGTAQGANNSVESPLRRGSDEELPGLFILR